MDRPNLGTQAARKLAGLGICTTLATPLAATLAEPAGATLPCQNPGWVNIHAGAETTPTPLVIGASAAIEYNYPQLCTPEVSGGTSQSVVWAMATGFGGGADNDGWSQVGYSRRPTQVQHFFMQTLECRYGCGSPVTFYDLQSPSTTHTYKVVYASNRYQNYRNTTPVGPATTWDPVASWSGPAHAEYVGEARDLGDDVVGTAGNPTGLTSLQVQGLFGGWATPSSLNRFSADPRYCSWKWGNDSIDVWTC